MGKSKRDFEVKTELYKVALTMNWKPRAVHEQLAEHIPAPAVYGIFRNAEFSDAAVTLPDIFQLEKAKRYEKEVRMALGAVQLCARTL